MGLVDESPIYTCAISADGAFSDWGCVRTLFMCVFCVLTVVLIGLLCRSHLAADGSRWQLLVLIVASVETFLLSLRYFLLSDYRITLSAELLSTLIAFLATTILAVISLRLLGGFGVRWGQRVVCVCSSLPPLLSTC